MAIISDYKFRLLHVFAFASPLKGFNLRSIFQPKCLFTSQEAINTCCIVLIVGGALTSWLVRLTLE